MPQDAVLPHASAIVGHGGHGTTVGALRHGIPLVVLPLFSVDQWAARELAAAMGALPAVGSAVDDLAALVGRTAA